MSLYRIYKGGLNKQDPYGCPPFDDPDCVQVEHPIGIMGNDREYEQMHWSEMLMRLKRFHGITPDRLKVGDELRVFLIPSYSDVRSVAYSISQPEDGFTFDVTIGDGSQCVEDPCAVVPPAPVVAGESKESDLSKCCTVTADGPATLADLGAEPPDKPRAIVMRKLAVDYVGSKAGYISLVIKTLPASPAMLTGSAKFRLRVNYENHLDCCHNCGDCC